MVTVWMIGIIILLIFFDFFIKQRTEVVGEHDEGGLHALCYKAQRPCFDPLGFVLELIKALLNAPAHEVELPHHAGGALSCQGW